jgi:hypothetical protein
MDGVIPMSNENLDELQVLPEEMLEDDKVTAPCWPTSITI